MRLLKSGARKKPWRVHSSDPGKDRTHSCSRFPFLSFYLCCGSFCEDRSARNGCCWAWRQRTRASWCHQEVSWCWCWEYVRIDWAFRVMQGDNPFFGSQLVAGLKALLMPLVAGQRQYWTCVVNRPDLFRDIGIFQHRQWNNEKSETRQW